MLKKILISLVLVVLLLPVTQIKAASSALSGPSVVRVGNTITLTLTVKATKMTGIQASVKYSTSQLTFVSYTDKLPTAWVNDYNHSSGNINIVAIDSKAASPLNSATVATIKFKVKTLAVGTKITVNVTDGVVALVGAPSQSFSASYSKSISSPLSTNTNLSSLSVSNATLTPKFSSTITTYETSVPFATDSLTISAKAADAKAKVTIANNKLVAGKTTNVNITVTSESGAKKTYVIKASREQDPNYVPSSEKRLKSVKVSHGMLSPAFSKDVFDYVLYLPFEISQLKIDAAVLDPLATSRIDGFLDLIVGENVIKVVGVAENKEEQVYQLTVVRAPQWGQPANDDQSQSLKMLLSELNSTYDNDLPMFFEVSLSTNSQLSMLKPIFQRLSQFTDATLRVNYGKLTLTFKSSTLKETFDESYNLSLYNDSEGLKKALSALGDSLAVGFQLGNDQPLPGIVEVEWALTGSYGTRVNIYRSTASGFSLVAESLSVDEFGHINFKILEQGTYLVSSKVVADSQPDVSLKIQNISGWYDDPIKLGGAIAIGILLLWSMVLVIGKERLRKRYLSLKQQANEKTRSAE